MESKVQIDPVEASEASDLNLESDDQVAVDALVTEAVEAVDELTLEHDDSASCDSSSSVALENETVASLESPPESQTATPSLERAASRVDSKATGIGNSAASSAPSRSSKGLSLGGKKKKSKPLVGTSENPLDVTELTADSGSLLELYQNDYFDAYMHMHHLYHRNNPGVHEYLVNLLYSKRTHEEIEFYLPQLCQLSIAKQGKSSLHRFLLDKASNSMHFALQLSWFYQAIIEDQAPKVSELAQKMTQETEMAVVNCKLFAPVRPYNGDDREDTEGEKELFISAVNLLDRKVCVRLITENRGHYKNGNGTVQSSVNDKQHSPGQKSVQQRQQPTQPDLYNFCTRLDDLKKPQLFTKTRYNLVHLTAPPCKIKLPSPFHKIGNPLDLEVHSCFDCNADMQTELQRLMMKQRRLTYFSTLNNLVKLCMEVSHLITLEPKRELREPLLKQFLEALNEWMLLRRCVVAAYEESFAFTGLSFPLKCMGMDKATRVPWQILRIATGEAKIFFSKKRVPFVLYMEVANLDEDATRLRMEGELKASVASFDDLWVFDAIVDDLLENAILTLAEVNALQNPLECIRYAIKMLPKSAYERLDEQQSSDDSGTCRRLKGYRRAHDVDNVLGGGSDANKNIPVPTTLEELAKLTPLQVRRIIWPELLSEKKQRLRAQSPYGCLKSWDLKAVLVKGGDDLRQENMANQLLLLFLDIFRKAGIPLWLRPIEILVTGANSGIMEFLEDTASVDVLKRKFNVESVAKIFNALFADNIYEARKNFIESHAGYSVISYLLQVKDRHNGNILLDSQGHVVHIDYGFCLTSCPGNWNFETSPFKLTSEYLDIIGGEASDNFDYFKTLIIRGLLEARKHVDRIVLLVEMMTTANKMPCFSAGTTYTIEALRERFMLNCSEQTCIDKIVAMINESLNNFRTIQYDKYQRLTNGIK